MRAIIIALLLSTPCYSQSILESLAPRTDDAQVAAAHRAMIQANAARKEASALGRSLRLITADKRELEKKLEQLKQELAEVSQRESELKTVVTSLIGPLDSLSAAVKKENLDDVKDLVASIRNTLSEKILPILEPYPVVSEGPVGSSKKDRPAQLSSPEATQGSKADPVPNAKNNKEGPSPSDSAPDQKAS